MIFQKNKRTVNPELLETVRNMRCIICNAYPCDPHHITTQGAGGGDTGDNLLPICRVHHTEVHKIGVKTFIKRYLAVRIWMEDHERWDVLEGT